MIGPYFGPFLSSIILDTISWRSSFWIVVGFVGTGLLLIIFLMEETAYDRVNYSNNPIRPEDYWEYRFLSLVGVMGHRAKGRQTLWQGALEILRVSIRPQFYLLCRSPGS